MTRRQKNFVDQYILNGGCASAAARAAGYSEKAAKVTGSKLLADGEVRSAIDARLSEIESSRVADEKELLEILTTIARGETTDESATPSGKVVTLKTNTATRLRAIETLLKLFGAFKKDNEQKNDGAQLFISTLEKAWQNIDDTESESACN